LFSAKGAAFINSLGQRPRVLRKIKSAALKARFRQELDVELTTKRRIESRQNLAAASWHEDALWALKAETMVVTPHYRVRGERQCS
jgi:hypothetical protein